MQSSSEDLTALLELRDVEDELNTIDKLFRDQETVLNDFCDQNFEVEAWSKGGLQFLRDAQSRLRSYRAQVSSIKANCASTQDAVRGI